MTGRFEGRVSYLAHLLSRAAQSLNGCLDDMASIMIIELVKGRYPIAHGG